MNLSEIVAALQPLTHSPAVAAVGPAVVSSILGAVVALVAYRFKSREPLAAAIAWRWTHYQDGREDEEPFLVVQNRSQIPAFLIGARILKGNFVRREAVRYAFSYEEHDAGNFPLEVAPSSVSFFPLSQQTMDKIIASARWHNRLMGYLAKRPYIWIELTTLSGRKIKLSANDAAGFRGRPLWLELRWFPPPRPIWL